MYFVQDNLFFFVLSVQEQLHLLLFLLIAGQTLDDKI